MPQLSKQMSTTMTPTATAMTQLTTAMTTLVMAMPALVIVMTQLASHGHGADDDGDGASCC
jgi:hypothetical protein